MRLPSTVDHLPSSHGHTNNNADKNRRRHPTHVLTAVSATMSTEQEENDAAHKKERTRKSETHREKRKVQESGRKGAAPSPPPSPHHHHRHSLTHILLPNGDQKKCNNGQIFVSFCFAAFALAPS